LGKHAEVEVLCIDVMISVVVLVGRGVANGKLGSRQVDIIYSDKSVRG
jgi:hypothetical protein